MSPMSLRRAPSLRPVGKTLDPGSVRAGLVCDTGITNWRGRGAVAFSAFCWLRQACFVTLAPLRVPDVTTEGTIPPPRRKNTRARFSKGRACVRDAGITNWRGRGLSPFSVFCWLCRVYICRACILHTSSAPSQGTRPRFASGTLRALPEGASLPPNLFNSSPIRPKALRTAPTSDILERD